MSLEAVHSLRAPLTPLRPLTLSDGVRVDLVNF